MTAPAPTTPESQTKACPYCGEQILAVAIKCKHCGERLAAAPSMTPAAIGFALPVRLSGANALACLKGATLAVLASGVLIGIADGLIHGYFKAAIGDDPYISYTALEGKLADCGIWDTEAVYLGLRLVVFFLLFPLLFDMVRGDRSFAGVVKATVALVPTLLLVSVIRPFIIGGRLLSTPYVAFVPIGIAAILGLVVRSKWLRLVLSTVGAVAAFLATEGLSGAFRQDDHLADSFAFIVAFPRFNLLSSATLVVLGLVPISIAAGLLLSRAAARAQPPSPEV